MPGLHSRTVMLGVTVIVGLGTAAGCVSGAAPAPRSVDSIFASVRADASDPSASPGAPPAGEPPALSAAHRAFALSAAHQDANQIATGRNQEPVAGWPSGINAVTAVVRPGTVTDSNTGHACESGTIIAVALYGDFDTVTTGMPSDSSTFAPDNTVREVDLSVDGTTGLTCLISVRVEPAPKGVEDIVLFSR